MLCPDRIKSRLKMDPVLLIILIRYQICIIDKSYCLAVAKLFQRVIVFRDLLQERLFLQRLLLHRENRVYKNMRVRDFLSDPGENLFILRNEPVHIPVRSSYSVHPQVQEQDARAQFLYFCDLSVQLIQVYPDLRSHA